MENDRNTWWFWIPALPKPLIVAAWAVFWLSSGSAPYIRHLTVPGQHWWFDIWYGLGGNAIGIFTWVVIATQLTSEVVYMIFTFRANQRQVEEAAIRNREQGREEGLAEGRAEGLVEGRDEGYAMRDQVWREWLDQIRDKAPEDWPPPPNLENGHKEE